MGKYHNLSALVATPAYNYGLPRLNRSKKATFCQIASLPQLKIT